MKRGFLIFFFGCIAGMSVQAFWHECEPSIDQLLDELAPIARRIQV